MKTFKALFCAIILLALGYPDQAVAAITVSDIAESEFNAFTADTSKVSWTITLYPGASAGIFFPEVRIYRSDGASVLLNHEWHKPEQILLSYGEAGKLGLSVGSTSAEIYPIIGFDSVLFQIKDDSIGATVLVGNQFDGISIPNLFADDPTEMSVTYDQVLLTGFGETFNYSGALDMGQNGLSAGTSSYLKIVGLTIPEPSSSVLLFFGAMLIIRRKR